MRASNNKEKVARERQFRLLVLAGCTVSQIAGILNIADCTVQNKLRDRNLTARSKRITLYSFFEEQDAEALRPAPKKQTDTKLRPEESKLYDLLSDPQRHQVSPSAFKALLDTEGRYAAIEEVAELYDIPSKNLRQVWLRIKAKINY